MGSQIAPNWISNSFMKAINEPLPEGINKNLLFGRSFDFIPEEKRNSVIEENTLAFVARRVAKWLSNLNPSKDEIGRSFDYYGTITNFAGHELTAVLFKYLKLDQAESYIKRVEQVREEILKIVNEKKSNTLREINFKRSLDKLDIPEGYKAKQIPLEHTEIIEKFAEALATKFKLTIVQRNETTSGTSLRATTDSETQQALVELAKKMLLESGLIKFFELTEVLESGLTRSSKLDLYKEAVCMILEGHEIYKWIEEKSAKHPFTDEELLQLKEKTAQNIAQTAKQIVFKGVMDRLEALVKEHPNFPLTAKEFAAFAIQEFYPRCMGFKVAVKSDPINQLRQEACPDIEPIEFPRLTVIGVDLPEVEPLEGLSSGQFDLIKLLKFVKKQTGDKSLNSLIHLLKRDVYTHELENSQKKT